MFDLFRRRDKAVRYLLGGLLGLVALSLVITLIPGYGTPTSAPEQVIAEVGKEQITVRQVQTAMQNAMRNRQMPPEMAQHYVPQLIDQMIAERAVALQAERMGFQVSEKELADAIRSMLGQVFPSGDFDRNVYTRFLQQQGLTVAEFERNVRSNLLLLKLQNLALEGVLVTPAEAEKEFRRKNDKIKLDYVVFTPGDLRSQVSVTPAEVQTFYNANKASFLTPERRSFYLLIADEAKIGQSVQMSDSELRAAYNRGMDKYRTPERVKARHILIKTSEAAKDQQPKAEAKANDLLKQIRGGADFAELAKKNSEDPGSAVNGGDLGWIVRGQMVPVFENATFSLKPKEISNVIKTEYGYHIVQTLEKEQARVKPFEEVRDQLATEAKKEAIYQRMQDAVEQARAELAKTPQQAEQIAAKHGLTFAKVDKVAKGESIPEVGTNPELEAALTGMKQGEVSPVLQVAPTKLAVVAVTEIVAPRPSELSEVEKQIRDTLTSQKAQQLADQKLKEVREKLQAAGSDLKAAAKAVGGQIKSTQLFTVETAADGIGPGTYVAEAFTKPVGETIPPFNMGNQLFLVKVAEKQPADINKLAAEREAMVLALKRKKAAERRELFEDGLITQLIKDGKVKKYQDNIKRLVNNYQG